MSDMQDRESRKLTFSQREGKAPLPEVLQVGRLTEKFKNRIWYVFENHMRSTNGMQYWIKLLSFYGFQVLEIPHDELKIDPSNIRDSVRNLIFGNDSHEILTLLEYILRFKRQRPMPSERHRKMYAICSLSNR